jgi:hypothetical protein
LEFIKAGKLRPLAVTTSARSAVVPDLPTVADFVPGYEASAWYGIVAPKGTPAEIVDKLNQAINAMLTGSDGESALYRSWRVTPSRLGRRFRQSDRRRDREMGQGHQIRRHQAPVIQHALGVDLKTDEERGMHDFLQSDGAMLDWIAVPNFLAAYQ